MATVTITHATVTGAAADPNALVDGPAWDEAHVATGLDYVASTNETNTWTATQTYSGSITINALSGENLQIGGNSGRFYFWPSGNTPIQFLNSSGAGVGYRFYQTDTLTSIYDSGVGRFHVGLIGSGTVSASPDGVNTSWAVSATDNMQMPHDNIILARAADGHNPGLTFKTTDILGGLDKPYGNIGVDTADSNKFRVSSGPTAANIPANNSLILATYNGTTEMERMSIPGGAGSVLISFPNFTSLGVQGFVGAGNSSTSPSQLFHGLAAAAGSVAATMQLDANNTTSGETHTAKYTASDNGAGTIRALFQVPGTLNAGTPNQGRFDVLVENGTINMMRVSSTAASGGTAFNLFDRVGAGAAQVTLSTFGTSTLSGGGLTVSGGVVTASGGLLTATHANGFSVTGGAATFSGGAVTVSGGATLNTHATAGVGYGTGAGGAVTQITSRTTGVTVNKAAGAITLVSAAGSATPASFTVTNSAVAATDTIILNQKSGTDKYILLVTAVAAGSFQITFYTTGGTTTEQPVFNFAVVKAVAA